MSTAGAAASVPSFSGMTNGNITVTYNPPSPVDSCKLSLSVGNGTALAVSGLPMTCSGGIFSGTVNHPSFTAGSKIYYCIVQTVNGQDQPPVPQGTLGDVTSWAIEIYTASSLSFSDMSNENITATYNPGSPVDSCLLCLSLGNGTGWVSVMNNNGGTYSCTFNNSNFTSGVKIYYCILQTMKGEETCVPQGTLSDVTSWAIVIYGPLTVLVPVPGPGPPPQPAPISFSGMTNGNITVTYNPPSPVDSCKLYLSVGNGTGLTIANGVMTCNGGIYSCTCNDPTFTPGANIYYCIVQTVTGQGEAYVPQGTLSDVTSWATVTYALPTPPPPSFSGMSLGYITATYNPGTPVDSCLLCLSLGSGTGWFCEMNNNGKSFSCTLNNSNFTPGTNISYCILQTVNGKVALVPQCVLGDDTSWATVTYPRPSQPRFTGMVNGNLTVTYILGVQVDSCALSLSMGNGAAPIVNCLPINRSGGIYSCTVNNPNFTDGTRIYYCIVLTVNGQSTCVPQGTLGDVTSWAYLTYGPPYLIPLKSGMTSTLQFANNTGGRWTDDQIYVTLICRDNSKAQAGVPGPMCHVLPDGTMIAVSAADNTTPKNNRLCAPQWSWNLTNLQSGNGGFQLSDNMDSARIYISYGSRMYFQATPGDNTGPGVAFPDFNNPTDPNLDIYFDYCEFAQITASWTNPPGQPLVSINTSLVDSFTLPLTIEVYEVNTAAFKGYSLAQPGIVGTLETRDSLFSEWPREVPVEFQGLLQTRNGIQRIYAPCKVDTGFGQGAPQFHYLDPYVDQIWALYTPGSPLIQSQFQYQGQTQQTYTVTGYAIGNIFQFNCSDAAGTVAIVPAKPTTQDVFLCNGALQVTNDLKGAMIRDFSAALNRHVVEDPANWYQATSWYPSPPCNEYAAFWPHHCIAGKAYGFPFADVGGGNSSIQLVGTQRGIIIGCGW